MAVHQPFDWYIQNLEAFILVLFTRFSNLSEFQTTEKTDKVFSFNYFFYRKIYLRSVDIEISSYLARNQKDPSTLWSSSFLHFYFRSKTVRVGVWNHCTHAFLMSFWQLPCEQTWVKMVFHLYVFVIFGVCSPDDLKLNVHANRKCCGRVRQITNVTHSQHPTNLLNGQISLSYF